MRVRSKPSPISAAVNPSQLEPQRAPAEQVRSAPPYLPGARPAQREADAAVLDQPMHFVEQARHLLDLVDHHLLARHRSGGLDLSRNRSGLAM